MAAGGLRADRRPVGLRDHRAADQLLELVGLEHDREPEPLPPDLVVRDSFRSVGSQRVTLGTSPGASSMFSQGLRVGTLTALLVATPAWTVRASRRARRTICRLLPGPQSESRPATLEKSAYKLTFSHADRC